MFSFFELIRRYRSLLDFKHRWIQKTGLVFLLISILSGLMWLLTVNFGYMVCSSEKVLLVVSITLNIVWQYFAVMGIFIIVSYMLWHIALQIYYGATQVIWVSIMICVTIIAVVCLPMIYRSEIGTLIYNRESGLDVSKDLAYMGDIISASDKTESKTITIDSGFVNMNYFNLYYGINVSDSIARSEYVIMSCADAKDMQNELNNMGPIDVSVTYNVDTKIVCEYTVIGKHDEAGPIPQNIKIWLEESAMKDIAHSAIMIYRPEIPYYDDALPSLAENPYWYITKNGEFYECRTARFRTSLAIPHFEMKSGDVYTITLVDNYNSTTGEYTPISNTVEYIEE